MQTDLDCVRPGRCLGDLTLTCDSDLDCAGNGPCLRAVVFLERGAKLLLDGHTLSTSDPFADDTRVVRCVENRTRPRCTVTGPGTLSGGSFGIYSAWRATAEDLTVSGADVGVFAFSGIGRGRVKLTNVLVTQCGTGVKAGKLAARDTRIEQSGIGARGNIAGVRLTVTGCSDFGLQAFMERIRLRDSTITGNGLAGSGIDIDADHRPRLRNSTCGLSRDSVTFATWGVCTND